jgi:hypothetical protein
MLLPGRYAIHDEDCDESEELNSTHARLARTPILSERSVTGHHSHVVAIAFPHGCS